MIDDKQLKILNFLQDYGCARLDQLQILFDSPNDSFNKLLRTHFISKKDNIFIHNTRRLNKKMLAALDIICIYKNENRILDIDFMNPSVNPVMLAFSDIDNNRYDIIVADKTDEQAIVKKINNLVLMPNADKYIFMFKDDLQLINIKFEKPYIYCTYPEINILKQVE